MNNENDNYSSYERSDAYDSNKEMSNNDYDQTRARRPRIQQRGNYERHSFNPNFDEHNHRVNNRGGNSYSSNYGNSYDGNDAYESGNNYGNSYNGNRGGYNQGRNNGNNYGNRNNGGYGQNRGNNYGNRNNGGYGYNQNHGNGNGYGNRNNGGGYGYNQGRNNGGNSYGNRGNNGGYNNQGNNNYGRNFNRNANEGRSLYSTKKQQEYKQDFMDYTKPIRLNKYLANSGVCSRREADDYIQAGVVKVNGEVVTELGTKVIPATDKILFHNTPVQIEKKVYILLNKPKNCVTTSDDPQERHTVLDFVRNACPQRVYPVGRLDKNTTGVILITNDGELASKLTHPKYDKKKIYQVKLDREFTEEDMEKLREGIVLEDGEIKADDISYVQNPQTKELDRNKVGIEIHSGRNRIVRRMFESLGYKISKLDRVYFAGLTKKNLGRGKWRFLSEAEVNILKMSN